MSERRPKKRPNVFAQVVANADEVVQASFIASGPATPADTVASGSTFASDQPLTPPAGFPLQTASPTAGASTTAAVAPTDAGPAIGAEIKVVSAGEPLPLPAPGASEPLEEDAHDATPAEEPTPTPATAWGAEPEPGPAPADVDPAIGEPEIKVTKAAELVTLPAPSASEPLEEDAHDATPAEERTPTPATAKSAPRRRPAPPPRRAGQTSWSHQAVLESFTSATVNSKSWKLHGFRVVPEILDRLKARLNSDRRSTGITKLAISHYLDAALRNTPSDVDAQIALAQEFLTARMGMVEAGKQSTYRVGAEASAWVSEMNAGLLEADYGRKGIYVVSATIESFLESLDAGGPLQRPERPAR